MVQDATTRALAAESAALVAVAAGLTWSDLGRPSPCPPWTAGQLLGHVVIAAGRTGEALAARADSRAPLISTAEYYRADNRFSAATNADRIQTAVDLARQLDAPALIAAELERRCRESCRLLAEAPACRTVRTRHGDRMLAADFGVTRLVELGVHGLDLAAALDRPPWLTGQAAAVLENLLLPGGDSEALRRQLDCDRPGLIARLTGRAPLSSAGALALRRAGAAGLAFG